MNPREEKQTVSSEADAYRVLLDELNDGVVVQDIATGAVMDMNRRAVEMFGCSRGTNGGPGAESAAEAFSAMLETTGREPQLFEWRAKDRLGRTLYLEVNVKRAQVGTSERLVTVVRDITQRREAQQALRDNDERYRAMIEASHDIIWSLDREGNFTFVNARGEELTGYRLDDWRGKAFAPLIHPDDLEKAQDAFIRTMAGERVRYDVRVVDAGGEVRQLRANLEPIHDAGEIVGLVGLGTDITVRTRLEDELHKAQKLESLGLLAGGIAHDFNNILTAIVGGVTLAKRCADQPELQRETLDMAERACMRARELTQQLLTFSRGGAPIRRPASIAELLHETARFALRGSNVRCKIVLAPDLRLVEMDPGQMSQVVNNLLINAAQAMPNGGNVELWATNHTLDSSDARLPTLRPGSYVRISIRDEGDGIPQQHLPNIFDPYFTTKPSGTGLGLATCYSIVRRHDGYIDVETVPGEGTTFHIYLPATEHFCLPSDEPPVPDSKRGGTVLLMDDDPMVRDVGAEMLRVLGFDAVVVSDGREAIEKYRDALERGRGFDAVILDLTVPGGMGGKETAVILRRLDERVRLIASSGYSTDPVMADHRRYGFDGVVAKPYLPEDLDRAMGSVLRER